MTRVKWFCVILGWVSAALAAQLGASSLVIGVVGFVCTFVAIEVLS